MTTPVRVRYQTIEFGGTDIHLCTLRDNQEFSDPNDEALNLGISSAEWPIFGVVWPSGVVLAHHMQGIDTAGKRILEIGCGMALCSLLLNKQNNDITATDRHPEAAFFLQRNTELNKDNSISFERVDWADETDSLGVFDIIIGSDILYEDEHIALLSAFLEKHAKPTCDIFLVDPGRGRKSKLSTYMEKYGYSCTHTKPVHTDYLEKPFKGHVLKFWRAK